MGRTTRIPYLRFQKHVEKNTDRFGRALRDYPNDFVVIQQEKVPEGTKLEDFRRREPSWILRLDTLRVGYDSRREMTKRSAPLLPVYGLGPAPTKRSRNPDRVRIPNLQARIHLRMDSAEVCTFSILYKINQIRLMSTYPPYILKPSNVS